MMPIIFTEVFVCVSFTAGESYPSWDIAFCTLSRVSLLIAGLSLHTRETVEGETPASFATSFIVTAIIALPFAKHMI